MAPTDTLVPGHRRVKYVGDTVNSKPRDEEATYPQDPHMGNVLPSQRFGLHKKANGEWR
jgi:hypothetical protein